VSARIRVHSVAAAALVLFVWAGIAVAAPTDPQIAIDPVDQAWANSIVVTGADLGKSWIAQPPSGGGSGTDDGSAWCPDGIPDMSDLIVTGGGSSPDFKRRRDDTSSVSSYAYVFQTQDQAQADWDRTLATTPAFLDCFAGLFKMSVAGVKFDATPKGAVAFPTIAPRTAVYRIKIVMTSSKRVKRKIKRSNETSYIDFVSLGNGRAYSVLFVSWFRSKPLPAGFERSLAEKVASRMATDPSQSSS
jgi:hypothetical protein